MRLENQVCSLELAKRLKELGVKQESLHYWAKTLGENEPELDASPFATEFGCYSAFTVAELGEMLPKGITAYCTNVSGKWGWKSFYIVTAAISVAETFGTEGDARAKMLIYLIENNLISV